MLAALKAAILATSGGKLYVAAAIKLASMPVFHALAFKVVVALMVTGAVYTVEVSVGSVPSVV